MKTTEKHLGTRITRRRLETTESETPEEFVQLLHKISNSDTHPFEIFLDELASEAANELRKKGLSCEWKAVLQQLKDEDYDSIVGYSARFRN
jgi:hypothetical protein